MPGSGAAWCRSAAGTNGPGRRAGASAGPSAPPRPVLAFAAVWDLWRAPGGAEVASLATVTCAPNADVAPVHDRMPVIVDRADWPLWLGEVEGDGDARRPLPDGELSVEPGLTGADG